MASQRSARIQYIAALGVSSLVSIGLFVFGAYRNQDTTYSYLIWNLFLAWLPLLFSMRLIMVLRSKLWSSWEALGLSILWLLFLPNSFYMISDFIHIQEFQHQDIVADALMFTSFIFTGVVLGFSSLYLVHLELKKRFTARMAGFWVALTLLASSIAIYIGRDLRWNSWDVITNPGGLLFDISERVINPSSYPEMFVIVLSFWALLLSMYYLLWCGARLVRQIKPE